MTFKPATADEPILAHRILYGLDTPTLRELLDAFAMYTVSETKVRDARMKDIEHRISLRNYVGGVR